MQLYCSSVSPEGLFVCLYVRFFVCSYVRFFVYSYVCMFVCSFVCMYVRIIRIELKYHIGR